MYDQTITLFNYRKDDRLWRTAVFHGVNVIEPRASTETTQGTANRDSVEIILHCSADKVAGNLQYVPPKAYQALDAVDGYFTLTPEVDFIAIQNRL